MRRLDATRLMTHMLCQFPVKTGEVKMKNMVVLYGQELVEEDAQYRAGYESIVALMKLCHDQTAEDGCGVIPEVTNYGLATINGKPVVYDEELD